MRNSELVLVSLLSWLIAISLGFGAIFLGKGKPPFIQAEHALSTAPKRISTSLTKQSPKLLEASTDAKVEHYLSSFNRAPDSFCDKQNLKNVLACLAFRKDANTLNRLKQIAERQQIVPCTAAGNRNRSWQLALALDQMKHLAPERDYRLLEEKLTKSLKQCLEVLDGGSASLWHGRFSIGAESFLVAASLSEPKELLDRAFYHFDQSVQALELTEGWPGGYNYWIQNRGLTFFLAVQTYLRSGEDSLYKSRLLRLAKRNALWHIYMTRPDGQIQPTGDEGSRVDLKDESKKVIDLLAKITRSPETATFADYIQQRHGRASYHPSYYWLIPFVYDPSVEFLPTKNKGLSVFDGWLPNNEIFGEAYFNQIILRTGWGSEDTFVLINGGQQFSHHQHADAGHFTYFSDGEPIAVDGAFYNGVLKKNRLYYGIRSNSKNLINLSTADTNYQPTHRFKQRVEDGTQNLSMPHGSAVISVQDWLETNRRSGKHHRSNLIQFDHQFPATVVLDLSPAYFSDKVVTGRVTRSFMMDEKGSLRIKDSFKGISGTIVSHLNLPSLTDSRCIDNDIEGIPVTPDLQLRIKIDGLPACASTFTQHFSNTLTEHLEQQKELSKGRAWSDGAFSVMNAAIYGNDQLTEIEFIFYRNINNGIP
ncbi:hypothetical protein [Lacimicrobium sp. SS2-24]|uniref:hypothetical protein n=1 Tax=Lacimicrobium sp. SS2-24 TaxID=2005569 RepID=UPI000B4BDE5C|nr:hypothetical protein [Lacimicrobium sp. SS2-24]